MQFRFGDGALVAAIAVGDLELILPSGLIIELTSVYVIPGCSRNIISVSVLDSIGYEFIFKNRCCNILRNGLIFASAYYLNGLYLIDLDLPLNNVNVNAKRLKTNDSNSSSLWHYRLGHINEKHIKKLQEDGLLGRLDWESLD